MTEVLRVDSPFDGEVVCEVPMMTEAGLVGLVGRARVAQTAAAALGLEARIALCERWLGVFEADTERIARDVSRQMGKPVAEARGEVAGTLDRARTMIALGPEALADEILPEKAGLFRKIAREPVGVVLVVAAWNYPLLIAVNGVIPAVLAGNAVILKHSARTPLCGEAFARTFEAAGAPPNLVAALHCSHETTAALVRSRMVDYVAFTGSVGGGKAVHKAAGGTLIGVSTELGGKDPAYVRADADLDFVIPNLVDGSCYNAGQSCCAIERIYVDRSVYGQVVEGVLAHARKLTMGDPLAAGTRLGPLAQAGQPAFLAAQIHDAKARGARILLDGEAAAAGLPGRFFGATVVADGTHEMAVMREESFGPIIALQAVSGDAEALERMNDSPYGLTASVWTQDVEAAEWFAPRLQTGTVFMNRCDYLDPMLPWTGVKDTGRGVSLSRHAFGPLTRLKSYHFRTRQ